MIIALIPARSGSKRIKNKNILRLGKKPLMINSLELCKNSKIFDKIHLSTDSKKYSKIAKKFGCLGLGVMPPSVNSKTSIVLTWKRV